MNKNNVYILILVILSLFALKALFVPGYYTSHDGWHQVVRLYYFNQSFNQGNLIPGYISNLYSNYGYPLFIFNYQLPWYGGVIFMSLGRSVFDAIKDVYIIGFLLSALTMYYYLRSSYSHLDSFVGSVLYLWTPYRFSNIFVRGAIGEATLFIFIPLVLLSVDKIIINRDYRYILLGAISISALITSHAIVAVLILLSVLLYSVIRILTSREYKKFINLIILFAFGLLLSSFYLLPAYILKKDTVFDQMIQGTLFDGQFVNLGKLIYSKWGYAFANSIVDGMSFQVGIANWIIILLSAVFILVNLFRNKINKVSQPLSFFLIFCLSILMIIPESKSVWNQINKLFFVDFHWRLLAVTTYTSSILCAFVASSLKGKVKYIFVLLIIALAIYTNRNHLRVNEYTNIPLNLYLQSELSTNTYDEYLPKQADSVYAKSRHLGSGLLNSDNVVTMPTSQNATNLSYHVEAQTEQEINAQLFYFPGWNVYIDNKKSDVKRGGYGLVNFTIPSGSHRIGIKYSDTLIMRVAKMISLLTAVFLIYMVYKNRRHL